MDITYAKRPERGLRNEGGVKQLASCYTRALRSAAWAIRAT
jgi:hypothetical protein